VPIFILLDEKKKAYFSLSNKPFLDVVRHPQYCVLQLAANAAPLRASGYAAEAVWS